MSFIVLGVGEGTRCNEVHGVRLLKLSLVELSSDVASDPMPKPPGLGSLYNIVC